MEIEFKSIEEARILRHLHILLESKFFRTAPRLRDFLRYVVIETLAGRGQQIKEYSIGVNVYGRRPDFNPKEDAIVRVEAIKLRARLAAYYHSAGDSRSIQILLPKGGYVPCIRQKASQYDSSGAEHVVDELCLEGDSALWRFTREGLAMARGFYSRAVDLAPTDPRGHIGLAYAYGGGLELELENPADLLPWFGKASAESLRLSPRNAAARNARSIFCCSTGEIGRAAIAEFQCALRADPSNPMVHFWGGGLMSARGNLDEAAQHAREAVRLESRSLFLQAYLGRVLLYAGELDFAVEKLMHVVRLDPSLWIVHPWLTIALTESGRFDEAIATAADWNARIPSSVAHCCLSYALARSGRKSEAGLHMRNLLSSGAYLSPAWMASVYLALEREDKAQECLASPEYVYPWIWGRVDPRLKGRAKMRFVDPPAFSG